MSCDTCAVRIKQRYEPIRILRAERVVQAAGNVEPVVVESFLFHLNYENTILPQRDDGQSRKSESLRAFCRVT